MTGPNQPYPGEEQYPWNPVDPNPPVNYPVYPPPPPYPGGPFGYGGPPGYPYGPAGTNGLAIASLTTSIAGIFLGVPLTFFCYLGLLIPLVGVVLGVVALNQIKHTHQQGRGLAIAGIAVGAAIFALLVLAIIGLLFVGLSIMTRS
ncbi:DUF4190 domain-containing protein [Mycobacterium branderi]|uniref:DUF4190 domain-containing protein n=1 Tax=Mycobacterium branderi TaxID=43348 RepID=A0A7I7W8A5_9MYCO|nr:DUF4190 domain-containing protein [Mycobacterium branderi]MCV7231201.1 DUF4190 domain-containing protein [Mycobacterium branderi]ORA35766.1 hypothetical protein BST20_17010 [Mycobacterium branderi]BBZ12821.1 hypothetical protein MBRA_30160 [Mycobacterium branderi]